MIRASVASGRARGRALGWLVLGALVIALLSLHQFRDHRRIGAMLRADPDTILADPLLRQEALTIGRPVYRAFCASCHGVDGQGDTRIGAPDFTRGAVLYGGGDVDEIEDIVRHGIRSSDSRGRHLASMPAYATEHPYNEEPLPSLTPREIEALTQYLLSFTHRESDARGATQGATLFADKAGCWDCHGRDAAGDTAIGAPNLRAARWLYGDGSHNDIYRSISSGRAGFSPAFKTALTAAQLRGVAVYVASLRNPTALQSP